MALPILGKVRFIVSYCRHATNQRLDAVFNDVDEADLALDTIADGQLYRARRAAQAGFNSLGDSSRANHEPRRADLTLRPGRGNQRGNNGGHAPSQGKHPNSLNMPNNSTFGASSTPKG